MILDRIGIIITSRFVWPIINLENQQLGDTANHSGHDYEHYHNKIRMYFHCFFQAYSWNSFVYQSIRQKNDFNSKYRSLHNNICVENQINLIIMIVPSMIMLFFSLIVSINVHKFYFHIDQFTFLLYKYKAISHSHS